MTRRVEAGQRCQLRGTIVRRLSNNKEKGEASRPPLLDLLQVRFQSEDESGAQLHLAHVGRRTLVCVEVWRGKLVDVTCKIRVV